MQTQCFDILKRFNLNKFKQRISLSTEPCLSYAGKASVKDGDIALSISIPYEYLSSWYDVRQSGTLGESNSFNKILNAFISQFGMRL